MTCIIDFVQIRNIGRVSHQDKKKINVAFLDSIIKYNMLEPNKIKFISCMYQNIKNGFFSGGCTREPGPWKVNI